MVLTLVIAFLVQVQFLHRTAQLIMKHFCILGTKNIIDNITNNTNCARYLVILSAVPCINNVGTSITGTDIFSNSPHISNITLPVPNDTFL